MNLRIGGFATLLQVFDMAASLALYGDLLGSKWSPTCFGREAMVSS